MKNPKDLLGGTSYTHIYVMDSLSAWVHGVRTPLGASLHLDGHKQGTSKGQKQGCDQRAWLLHQELLLLPFLVSVPQHEPANVPSGVVILTPKLTIRRLLHFKELFFHL